MDIVVSDLKLMSPSDEYATNNRTQFPYGINFCVVPNYNYANSPLSELPLIQSLPGSSLSRTNILENVFWLSRQNLNGHASWIGTGYTVIATNSSPLFPLYRFVTNAPVSTDPNSLFIEFISAIQANAFTNTGWSHLIDGVVDFHVQPFDVNGYGITNNFQYNSGQYTVYTNTAFYPPQSGVPVFYFLSNSIPASVEIQMGSLEDAVLRRAESFGAPSFSQSNYLSQQVGRVHVFRQRVLIPNVDPSAYQ
jgi:hypothetical protein